MGVPTPQYSASADGMVMLWCGHDPPSYVDANVARAALGVIGKNKLINGGFTINQRAYVSAAALAAGVYGHDGWKAGASGGDYSFTQLASPTTITISAGKSLVQIAEDKNIEGGSYTLSWTGNATARVTVNSATPSGNFAVSPITVSGQTAGTTMSVEFTGANASGGSSIASNTGTLGLVQLEASAAATPFEFRLYPTELALCKRYYQVITNPPGSGLANGAASIFFWSFPLPVAMRSVPTVSLGGSGVIFTSPSAIYTANSIVANLCTTQIWMVTVGTTAPVPAGYLGTNGTAASAVFLDASL